MVVSAADTLSELEQVRGEWSTKEFGRLASALGSMRRELSDEAELNALKHMQRVVEQHTEGAIASVAVVSALCSATVHYAAHTETEVAYEKYVCCLRMWLALLDADAAGKRVCGTIVEYKSNECVLKVLADQIYQEKSSLGQSYSVEIICRLVAYLQAANNKTHLDSFMSSCRSELRAELESKKTGPMHMIANSFVFQQRFNRAHSFTNLRSFTLASVAILMKGKPVPTQRTLHREATVSVDYFCLEIFMEGYHGDGASLTLRLPYSSLRQVNCAASNACMQVLHLLADACMCVEQLYRSPSSQENT